MRSPTSGPGRPSRCPWAPWGSRRASSWESWSRFVPARDSDSLSWIRETSKFSRTAYRVETLIPRAPHPSRGPKRMEFSNERTWLTAVETGTQEEFHSRFESAVYKVREDFGDTHAIHIGDEAITGRATFEDRSPADLRILLGRFQSGTVNDGERAIAAAKSAFPEWSRTDPIERVKIMHRSSDRIPLSNNAGRTLITLENGKNRFEAVA